MLGWLVDRKTAPHIPVFDKAGRCGGTWSRADFEWDAEHDQYICPERHALSCEGSNPLLAGKNSSSIELLRAVQPLGDLGNPLTANWAKSKTGKKHPYYMCFKKGCDSYRKSIRRDALEGVRIPVYPAGHSDNIRPPKPGHPVTFGAPR